MDSVDFVDGVDKRVDIGEHSSDRSKLALIVEFDAKYLQGEIVTLTFSTLVAAPSDRDVDIENWVYLEVDGCAQLKYKTAKQRLRAVQTGWIEPGRYLRVQKLNKITDQGIPGVEFELWGRPIGGGASLGPRHTWKVEKTVASVGA